MATSALSQDADIPVSTLIAQLQLRAGGSPAGGGNRITVLQDAGENFPEWLAALRSAERFILIEMYIFADDAFGREVLVVLLEKQRAGVQVVLVYDWLGSLKQWATRFFRPLQQAGALVAAYNPIGFASGLGLLSRNHRKSIVIDGHTAFVSGLCISSAWLGQPEKNIAPWRDTGLKIRGPAVADVIAALADTLQSQGLSLPENIAAAPLPDGVSGSQRAAVVATTSSNNNMMRLDLNALALCNHHLWLTDAYFMPTRLYTQALINASYAGVDVRLLVPKTSDIRWIARVSRTRYRELLQAGVRIYEWNGPMIHAKSAIADGLWARVGSTNLNFSSWHLNRELDVAIEDADVVAQLERQFLRDLEHSSEIVLNEDDNAVARKQRREWFKQLKTLHPRQTKAVARQMMNLSQALKGNLHESTVVDEHETGAYLYLGLILLAFALVLWFFPKILVLPVVLLLLAGGASTTIFALKQRRRFKRRQHKP